MRRVDSRLPLTPPLAPCAEGGIPDPNTRQTPFPALRFGCRPPSNLPLRSEANEPARVRPSEPRVRGHCLHYRAAPSHFRNDSAVSGGDPIDERRI